MWGSEALLPRSAAAFWVSCQSSALRLPMHKSLKFLLLQHTPDLSDKTEKKLFATNIMQLSIIIIGSRKNLPTSDCSLVQNSHISQILISRINTVELQMMFSKLFYYEELNLGDIFQKRDREKEPLWILLDLSIMIFF